MKIDTDIALSLVYLKELKSGDTFIDNGDIYILSNQSRDSDDYPLAIKLSNGSGKYFHPDGYVKPIITKVVSG